jgi:[ribosomal protein S18]-alanine N-acetyltransferase
VLIRSMIAADIEAVMQLENDCVEAAHWPLAQYALLVEPGVASAGRAIKRRGLVAEFDGRVVGFLAARGVAGEAELENMAVSAIYRRRGFGAELLEEFLEWCAAANCSGVHLEVRESNAAARALYQRHGFRESGRRRDYYSNPSEDALTMTLTTVRGGAEAAEK